MANPSWVDFLIGFTVSLIASIMNAAGLNLLKLDHVRNSARSPSQQRNECGRPLWHMGLYLYVGSQLAGSTIALNFLKTQWVAPLGSIALIFNFVFAKLLVGTQITRNDLLGTFVVICSVVWIVVFGGMNTAGDEEDNLTMEALKLLFSRPMFIIWFSILNIITFILLILGMYAYWAISHDDASGQRRKNMKITLTKWLGKGRLSRASGLTTGGDEGMEAEARDTRLKKAVAMIMSGCGGLIASQTLLLAKSGVKLITATFNGVNQFSDNLSYFILIALVVTAVLQVYCLNTALKLYDSVLVVPMFYGFYTAMGLINSTIYLDQLSSYQPWVLLLVLVGIASLIYGVRMLSAPKADLTAAENSMNELYNDGHGVDDDDEDNIPSDGSHNGNNGHDGRVQNLKTNNKGNDSMGNNSSTTAIKKKSKFSLHLSPKSIKKRFGRKELSTSSSTRGVLSATGDETDVDEYGSRRGMMDDDGKSVGSSYGRGSFMSKSSFQDSLQNQSASTSGPLGRNPDVTVIMDTRGIPPPLPSHLNQTQQQHSQHQQQSSSSSQLTHVLVDTSEEIDLESRESVIQRQFPAGLRAPLGKRGSIASIESNSDLEDFLGRSRSSRGAGGYGSGSESGKPRGPQNRPSNIDTAATITRGRTMSGQQFNKPMSASPRRTSANMLGFSNSPLMSPSEFRAQYTNSQLPLKPAHLVRDGSPAGNGSRSASPVGALISMGGGVGSGPGSGRSPRWSTGSQRFDHVLEELNPFKAFGRGESSSSFIKGSIPSPTATSTTTGINGPSSASSNGRHIRQESFSGLPSTWDAPKRQRHSMLFGPGATGSGHRSRSASPSPTTPTGSRRNSQIVQIATGGMAVGGGDESDNSPTTPTSYQNHFFTGTPGVTTGVISTTSIPAAIPQQQQQQQSQYPEVRARQLSFTSKSGSNTQNSSIAQSSTSSMSSSHHSTSTTTVSSTTTAHVQQQLAQLSQHQHHPTSHLQHSITTSSSVSTIASIATVTPGQDSDDDGDDMARRGSDDDADDEDALPRSNSSRRNSPAMTKPKSSTSTFLKRSSSGLKKSVEMIEQHDSSVIESQNIASGQGRSLRQI